jgi:putative transposase
MMKITGVIYESITLYRQPNHGDIEAERRRLAELCREYGISQATLYKWRSKYGGMDVALMPRLKELEAENARLKRMYAEERIKSDLRQEALEGIPPRAQ